MSCTPLPLWALIPSSDPASGMFGFVLGFMIEMLCTELRVCSASSDRAMRQKVKQAPAEKLLLACYQTIISKHYTWLLSACQDNALMALYDHAKPAYKALLVTILCC